MSESARERELRELAEFGPEPESAFFELRPDVAHLGLFPDDDGAVWLAPADPDPAFTFVNGRLRWDDRQYSRALEAHKGHVKAHAWQLALDTYRAVDAQAGKFLDHARIRKAMGTKFRQVFAATDDRQYLTLAEKLEQARHHAIYEIDTIDCRPHVEWFGRAGLVKYCPDDARDAAMRAQARYVPRLVSLMAEGYEIRFGVFTWPNVPHWHLEAGIYGIMNAFRDRILYARTDEKIAKSLDDKRRRFPSLRGAVATLEAPLSARGDWNVHLNVLMAFRPVEGDSANWRPYRGRMVPDYEPLQAAWGAGVKFLDVPADPDAAEAAVRELVKYPFKAISKKSAEKSSSRRSSAPPWLAWPLERVIEWHEAHKGFRRTRSWGELYAGKCPEPERRSGASRVPLGTIRLTPAACIVSVPIPAAEDDLFSIIGAKFRAPNARAGPDPPRNRGH